MEGLIRKTAKFVVKNFDDNERIVRGYGAFYGNEDSDGDIIHQGAFARSLKEWGPKGEDRIKLCAQHDMYRPIAKMIHMKEDDKGLYIEARFGTHQDGEDYYRMAKEGIINEFSVGFMSLKDEPIAEEKPGRHIYQGKLYEVSMVTIAANNRAVVTDVKEDKDPLKLAKQVEDKDLRFKLELELLRLMSKSQETSTQAEVDVDVKEISPEQEVEKKSDIMADLLNLYKTN